MTDEPDVSEEHLIAAATRNALEQLTQEPQPGQIPTAIEAQLKLEIGKKRVKVVRHIANAVSLWRLTSMDNELDALLRRMAQGELRKADIETINLRKLEGALERFSGSRTDLTMTEEAGRHALLEWGKSNDIGLFDSDAPMVLGDGEHRGA